MVDDDGLDESELAVDSLEAGRHIAVESVDFVVHALERFAEDLELRAHIFEDDDELRRRRVGATRPPLPFSNVLAGRHPSVFLLTCRLDEQETLASVAGTLDRAHAMPANAPR